jgi:hypothetical protein
VSKVGLVCHSCLSARTREKKWCGGDQLLLVTQSREQPRNNAKPVRGWMDGWTRSGERHASDGDRPHDMGPRKSSACGGRSVASCPAPVPVSRPARDHMGLRSLVVTRRVLLTAPGGQDRSRPEQPAANARCGRRPPGCVARQHVRLNSLYVQGQACRDRLPTQRLTAILWALGGISGGPCETA